MALSNIKCSNCKQNGIQEYDRDGFSTCIYCGQSSYTENHQINIIENRLLQGFGICINCGKELQSGDKVITVYKKHIFLGYICNHNCNPVDDLIFREE